MTRAVWVSSLFAFLLMGSAYAQEVESDADDTAEKAYQAKLRELDWVKAPSSVTIARS